MYQTNIGQYNGDSWEAFIQICLKHKYSREKYQRMDATVHGDLGIEGFTLTGKVFQCYCPDSPTTTRDLTDKQKVKVNNDLNKLVKNCEELKRYLNPCRITEWILITPEYKDKDLLRYCREKTNEYRSKNLEILSSDFDILIHELEDYAEQIPIALQHLKIKLDIQHSGDLTDTDISEWRDGQVKFINNAFRKYSAIIPHEKSNRESIIEKLTNITVKDYLLGNTILKQWELKVPEKYEAFISVIGSFERKVEREILLTNLDANTFYKLIEEDLKTVLEREFPEISTAMISNVTSHILSRWILECNMKFD